MRRSYGRDLGLSVRMAVALAIAAGIYVVVEGALVALLVAAIQERAYRAVPGFVMFAVGVPVLLVAQMQKSGSLVLRTVRAKDVSAREHPGLHGLVARVAAQADLPAPRIAVARSWAPNALAVGRTPATGTIVVTTELLRRLGPAELEAVVAHELAHLANRDSDVLTFVSGPALACSHFLHNDDLRGKLVWAMFLWPLHGLGLALQWTVSRYREYAADRGAALVTGAPEQVMSALVTLHGLRPPRRDLRGGRAVQAFCIVPTKRARHELFSDHPPLEKRLARLAELARDLGRPDP